MNVSPRLIGSRAHIKSLASGFIDKDITAIVRLIDLPSLSIRTIPFPLANIGSICASAAVYIKNKIRINSSGTKDETARAIFTQIKDIFGWGSDSFVWKEGFFDPILQRDTSEKARIDLSED